MPYLTLFYLGLPCLALPCPETLPSYSSLPFILCQLSSLPLLPYSELFQISFLTLHPLSYILLELIQIHVLSFPPIPFALLSLLLSYPFFPFIFCHLSSLTLNHPSYPFSPSILFSNITARKSSYRLSFVLTPLSPNSVLSKHSPLSYHLIDPFSCISWCTFLCILLCSPVIPKQALPHRPVHLYFFFITHFHTCILTHSPVISKQALSYHPIHLSLICSKAHLFAVIFN